MATKNTQEWSQNRSPFIHSNMGYCYIGLKWRLALIKIIGKKTI